MLLSTPKLLLVHNLRRFSLFNIELLTVPRAAATMTQIRGLITCNTVRWVASYVLRSDALRDMIEVLSRYRYRHSSPLKKLRPVILNVLPCNDFVALKTEGGLE